MHHPIEYSPRPGLNRAPLRARYQLGLVPQIPCVCVYIYILLLVPALHLFQMFLFFEPLLEGIQGRGRGAVGSPLLIAAFRRINIGEMIGNVVDAVRS